MLNDGLALGSREGAGVGSTVGHSDGLGDGAGLSVGLLVGGFVGLGVSVGPMVGHSEGLGDGAGDSVGEGVDASCCLPSSLRGSSSLGKPYGSIFIVSIKMGGVQAQARGIKMRAVKSFMAANVD